MQPAAGARTTSGKPNPRDITSTKTGVAAVSLTTSPGGESPGSDRAVQRAVHARLG